MVCSTQGSKQFTDLIIHFLWVGNGAFDLLADKFAEASAQAMDGNFDAAFRDTEFGGEILVRLATGVGEVGLEGAKEFFLTGGFALILQLLHDAFEEGEGPFAVETFFRRGVAGRFQCFPVAAGKFIP